MKRCLLILALLFFAAPSAEASPSTSVERKIEILLSARHRLPSRDELERAVPEAKALLIALAEREELFLYYRHRAIDALSHWKNDDDVRGLYLSLLASDRLSVKTKQRILLRIPPVFGDAAEEVLAPYADHRSPLLRRAAQAALQSRILQR